MAKVINLNWPIEYEKYLKKLWTVKVRKGDVTHIESRRWWGPGRWFAGKTFIVRWP